MHRAPFIAVVATALCTALVAAAGSAAMPQNTHTLYTTWVCPDGAHPGLVNYQSKHEASFWIDGTVTLIESVVNYGTDTYVVEDGPTATGTWFVDYGHLAQGDGFAQKLLGPCQTTLVFPFAGVVDAELAAWLPELAGYIGQPYTATEWIEIHAVFIIPHR